MAQFSFDRRRVNGPEESVYPIFDDETTTVRKPAGRRKDRANDNSIEGSKVLQPGLISQATGSAYIETEKTKLACAIYGPRQSKNTGFHEQGRLNVEVKFAPYSCQKLTDFLPYTKDAEDRSVAMAIHQALVSSVRLETFPKATIDIFVTVIETDGMEGCVAAGSTAASIALAHAGIELLGLVASCSAAVVGDEIWLDPTNEESLQANGTLVLSCMPALNVITNIWQTGRMGPGQVLSCMEACQSRCDNIHTVAAQALLVGST